MRIILTKREYDDLVKAGHAAELLIEEKLEAEKSKLRASLADQFRNLMSDMAPGRRIRSETDLLERLRGILKLLE